jgi:hypothetical protein
METLFNVINPFFTQNKWQPHKKDNNTVYYRNKCDEFVITVLPKTNEIEITIPLHEVLYKNKFYNLNVAVEYVKMHLNYYHIRQ